MFLDEARISVQAGRGGDGSASFRREKFIPRGGPDGGDGGYGGHVYLRVKESIHGLARLAATHRFAAENGENGMGKKMYGRKGKDITIDVPPGTLVYERRPDGTRTLLVDMATKPTELVRIARGGKGGLGNVHFASATNQAPREFTRGTPGERKELELIVQHIADVGIIGLPNVGKSTFLARVSSAKPKVANYPFTTLEPHLGVIERDGARWVAADIPGLIAGASEGKGLGDAFLKHIRRTRLLAHFIDALAKDPLADYRTVRAELEAFDPSLSARPELVVVSRIDAVDATRQNELRTTLAALRPFFISSATNEGVDELLGAMKSGVMETRQPLDGTPGE
jgi:GTP-binding protein